MGRWKPQGAGGQCAALLCKVCMVQNAASVGCAVPKPLL